MTTVNRLEDVSLMDAGLDLVSGRKPPDAVDTESQEPARARGEVVSSMDMDFDGRVAGLRCCDVLLLSVFSARAAILSGRGHGWQEEKQGRAAIARRRRAMQRSFRGSSMAWLVCKPAIVANCAAVLFKRLCRAASKFAKAVLVCPYPSDICRKSRPAFQTSTGTKHKRSEISNLQAEPRFGL